MHTVRDHASERHNGYATTASPARTLVERARAGDAAAFGELVAIWQGPITGYLYRLTGDRALADDLAQETFLRAYRAIGEATPDLCLRPWLHTIATNLARSHFRHRRLLRWLPFGPDTPEPPDERAAASAEGLGDRELIEATLRRIGHQHAAVLLLRHYQGLSLDETAAVLGVSPNTAKTRLFRARRAFVAAWDEPERHP